MLPNEVLTPGLSAPTALPETAASAQSGVSWAAVIAGGVTAAAVAIILLLLGSGLGLASISPWAGRGMSAASFTVFAAIWLIIVQWVASGLGGYMAGRLRTKWVAVHTDEVLFRDTAHGFLSWALGLLVTTMVLAAASGNVVSNGTQLAAQAASNTNIANRYYVDLLFRQNANPALTSGGSALGTPPPSMPQACRSSLINKCAPKPWIFWRKLLPMAACHRPTISICPSWWRNAPGCLRQTPKSGSRMY